MPIVTHARLIDLEKLLPEAVFDIRYATDNNFTKKIVYPAARCFLEEQAAYALRKVQDNLNTRQLRLKIFDGYRPLSVQRIFWSLVPDERYVANPAKGSRHNRGCAIDLTLVDAQGKELPMGTEFDDFTERAHRICKDLKPEERANRLLLEKLMTQQGFIGLPTEWWHFDFKDWEKYPLLDDSFEKLDAQQQ